MDGVQMMSWSIKSLVLEVRTLNLYRRTAAAVRRLLPRPLLNV